MSFLSCERASSIWSMDCSKFFMLTHMHTCTRAHVYHHSCGSTCKKKKTVCFELKPAYCSSGLKYVKVERALIASISCCCSWQVRRVGQTGLTNVYTHPFASYTKPANPSRILSHTSVCRNITVELCLHKSVHGKQAWDPAENPLFTLAAVLVIRLRLQKVHF